MLPQLPLDGSIGNLPVKYWKQYKILTRQGKWKSLGAIASLDFRYGNGIFTEESNKILHAPLLLLIQRISRGHNPWESPF